VVAVAAVQRWRTMMDGRRVFAVLVCVHEELYVRRAAASVMHENENAIYAHQARGS